MIIDSRNDEKISSLLLLSSPFSLPRINWRARTPPDHGNLFFVSRAILSLKRRCLMRMMHRQRRRLYASQPIFRRFRVDLFEGLGET